MRASADDDDIMAALQLNLEESKEKAAKAQQIAAMAIQLQKSSPGKVAEAEIYPTAHRTKQPSVIIPRIMREGYTNDHSTGSTQPSGRRRVREGSGQLHSIKKSKLQSNASNPSSESIFLPRPKDKDIYEIPVDSTVKARPTAKSGFPPLELLSHVAKKTARSPTPRQKTTQPKIKGKEHARPATAEKLADVGSTIVGEPRNKDMPKHVADEEASYKPPRSRNGPRKNNEEPKKIWGTSSRILGSASEDIHARSSQIPISSNTSISSNLYKEEEEASKVELGNVNGSPEESNALNIAVVVAQAASINGNNHADPLIEVIEDREQNSEELESEVLDNAEAPVEASISNPELEEEAVNGQMEYEDEDVGGNLEYEDEDVGGDLETSGDQAINHSAKESGKGHFDGDLEEVNKGAANNEDESEFEGISDEESEDEASATPRIELYGMQTEWRGIIKAVKGIWRQTRRFELASEDVKSLVECVQEFQKHHDRYTARFSRDKAGRKPLFRRLKARIDVLGPTVQSSQRAEEMTKTQIRDIYLHGIPRLVLLLERSMTLWTTLYSAPEDISVLKEIIKLQDLTIALCGKPRLYRTISSIKFRRPVDDPPYMKAVSNKVLPPLRDIRHVFGGELRRRQDEIHEASIEQRREQTRILFEEKNRMQEDKKRRKIEEKHRKMYEDLLRIQASSRMLNGFRSRAGF
ncbi:hypothetical protein MMC14_004052 [Varicellaria rhodocarpa]|nr:hypothetical protein [Varicellaria rhodocarpa]